jgi:hypothetical protein
MPPVQPFHSKNVTKIVLLVNLVALYDDYIEKWKGDIHFNICGKADKDFELIKLTIIHPKCLQ